MIDNYKDITLGTYLDILSIDKDLDGLDYQVRVIALLSGKTDDEILDMPLPEYKKMAEATAFLTKPAPDPEGSRLPATMTLNGMKLIITKDPAKMCVAQYVDYQQYLKAGGLSRLPELLSCIMIPEGKEYNEGYDVVTVQQAIRLMPLQDAQMIAAFFLRKSVDYMRAILTSSRLRIKLKPKRKRIPAEVKMLKALTDLEGILRSGAGSRMLMQSASSLVSRGLPSGR